MLIMAPSMHTDFTPARVNGKCVQVSIFANLDETLYYFSEHKGHQGIADTPVERYLQDAIDNEPELTWHKQMKDLFSEVMHEAKQTRDFSPERILQIEYTNNRAERGLRKNLFLTAQEVFSNS